MGTLTGLVGLLLVLGVVAYHRLALVWACAAVAGYLLLWGWWAALSFGALAVAWGLFAVVVAGLLVPGWRRAWLTAPALARLRSALPPVSATEREALEAGSVGWEGELFSGRPRWRHLLAVPAPRLSEREQAFVDGPVAQLCAMLDDWHITHERGDLPSEVWQFIREQRFFGMIIPAAYGGLEFSAQAHSAVVMKIATRSTTAAVTVMVPNSLGPAELLLHYGTDAQKDYYLPRLARGEEIPCFALTGPEAGSDAASIPDRGVVCKGIHDDQEVLGIRLNWDKRYITLGPVATVLGLAFRLEDPDRLLAGNQQRGITLALIPTDTPGVTIGRRHYPLNIAFQNGPTQGKDVFIPMDWVIGGPDRVGQGWRMLMESLAAGRAISLPALSTGAGKLASRATGAYARVRRQFKLPIGRFEGVAEALARIAGETYTMDAARMLTAGAVNQGEQPAVASGIVKYQLTERMRRVINDAMDVHGGRAICLGPSNYLGRVYQAIPISITVEGANILTRSLIIFGQGAIRCHPYIYQELQAAQSQDSQQALARFDPLLRAHLGFSLSNAVRSLWLGLTAARLATVPVRGPMAAYCRQLNRMSAAFALTADVALATLGGALKRKERLSGRLADCLGELYLASAVVKQFRDQGEQPEDLALARWSLDKSLYQAQEALHGVLANLPSRALGWGLRALVFPLGRPYSPPTDRLGQQAAETLLSTSASRDRLTAGMYQPGGSDLLALLEQALAATLAAEPLEARLREAEKGNKALGEVKGEARLTAAVEAGLLEPQEADQIRQAETLRRMVIQVDDFDPQALGIGQV